MLAARSLPNVDPNFQARFTSALTALQTQAGESITIAGTGYTCTESQNVSIDLDYEQGGAVENYKAAVIVAKSVLATAPIRGTTATFRTIAYRVTEVVDLFFNWEIHLVQLTD